MPYPPFRRVVNTWLYILLTGSRWCDIPCRVPGAAKSAAQRWQADGTRAAMRAWVLGTA